jgi:hypothetical protein
MSLKKMKKHKIIKSKTDLRFSIVKLSLLSDKVDLYFGKLFSTSQEVVGIGWKWPTLFGVKAGENFSKGGTNNNLRKFFFINLKTKVEPKEKFSISSFDSIWRLVLCSQSWRHGIARSEPICNVQFLQLNNQFWYFNKF